MKSFSYAFESENGTANETPCFSLLEDALLSVDREVRRQELVEATEFKELREDFLRTETRPFPETIDSQDAYSDASLLAGRTVLLDGPRMAAADTAAAEDEDIDEVRVMGIVPLSSCCCCLLEAVKGVPLAVPM